MKSDRRWRIVALVCSVPVRRITFGEVEVGIVFVGTCLFGESWYSSPVPQPKMLQKSGTVKIPHKLRDMGLVFVTLRCFETRPE